MNYFEEIKRSMTLLSEHPKTIFIGQSIQYEGTGLFDSLSHIPSYKKIEFPIAEYLQTGISNGLAIGGMIPVSIYPRWNFLLLGTDQIVNHLDKFITMSDGKCKPKVIIRVAIGAESPIDPQDQHKGDFTDGFRVMTKNINIVRLISPEDIFKQYEYALNRNDGISTILVEYGELSRKQ